jgi:hypothetical protein
MASNSKFLAELLDSNGDVNTANLDNLSSTLGTASTNDTGDFLQVSNNFSDLNNVDTSLTNLGFSAFGKSIIDDADAAAVRTTLGLGEAATADSLGGSQDFTVTGTLANGDVVSLRSDGTVEKVATTASTVVGTPAEFESASTNYISATFDSNTNTVVIAYSDAGNSNYGTAVVGTVSGTSITFGTPVVFESASTTYISAAFYGSTKNKVVIVYRDGGNFNKGTACYGTVSGTSISFGGAGAPIVFSSDEPTDISVSIFNSTQIVITYARGGGGMRAGFIVTGGIGGSNYLSFNTPIEFAPDHIYSISATFDSNRNRLVVAYRYLNSNANILVRTTSGGALGSGVTFPSADNISLIFDSNSNKVVIAYTDRSNNYGTALVGTVSGVTGDTITLGTPVVFNSAVTSQIKAKFDSNTNRVVIAYRDGGNNNYGTAVVGTVFEDTIGFGTPVVFESADTNYISATIDSNTNKVVIAYQDNGNSSYGTAALLNVGNTNADTWMGIADGTSGTVKIMGGVAEGLTGLTTGAIYYVNYDGTLTATENAGPLTGTYGKIGKALSSTKLLITEGNA